MIAARLPERLYDAYLDKELVVIAGPSVAGEPARADLARRALDQLHLRWSTDREAWDRRLGRGDHPPVFGALQRVYGEAYAQEVRAALGSQVREDPLVAAIARLAPRLQLVVASDLSQTFDTAFGGRWPAYHRPPADRTRHFVFKLHGIRGDAATWVLSTDDFDRAENDPERQLFLAGLLRHRTILYLDFDPNNREFARLRGALRTLPAGQRPHHFAYFTSEDLLDEDDQQDLQREGIQVLSRPGEGEAGVEALLAALAEAQAEAPGTTAARAGIEAIVSYARGGAAPPARWHGTLLVFTANGQGAGRVLSLEEELRDLRERLRGTALKLEISPAASLAAVVRDLDAERPLLVHFSAHGAASGELLLREGVGTRKVSPEELGRVLELMPERPRLVTFAACYSRELAESAARFVPHAIGFSEAVPDQVALAFSRALYERLLAGDGVPLAFNRAVLVSKAEHVELFPAQGAS